MDATQLKLLKDFVKELKKDPNILHLPEISFFKEWLIG
jgi:hypothetical protein